MHLGPSHPQRPVGSRFDRVSNRRPEAGPSGSTLELRIRGEQGLATSSAPKNAFAVLFVQRAGPRALGAVFAQHVKLFGRQSGAPTLIVLWNVHPANLPDSIDSERMRIAVVA